MASLMDPRELSEASQTGNVTKMRILIEVQNIPLTTSDDKGRSVLHWAVMGASVPAVEYLLNLPASSGGSKLPNLNIRDAGGNTGLQHAALQGSLDIVQLLTKQELIDLNSQNQAGKTALHCAAFKGNPSILRHLVTCPGIDLSIKDMRGCTALHDAACQKDGACMRMLLEKASPDIILATDTGNRNVLHYAAFYGCVNVVRELLVFPDHTVVTRLKEMTNKDGLTPCMLAKQKNHGNIAAILLAAAEGANPNEEDVIESHPEVSWEWEDWEHGTWTKFDDKAHSKLEDLYESSITTTTHLAIAGNYYSINVNDMVQINAATGNSRTIRRRILLDEEATTATTARFTEYLRFEGPRANNLLSGVFDDANNPLVSLSDALRKLPFSVNKFLMAAKFHMKRPHMQERIAACPNLSPDGAMAIYLYTSESPLYRRLNQALRDSNLAELQNCYFPYLRICLVAFQRIMNARRNGGGAITTTTVNRGVKLDLVQQYPDEYREGNRVTWWAFSSCTTKIKVLENPMFVGTTGPRTIFQIRTHRAVDISGFSAIPESEAVLVAGTTLEVESFGKLGDDLTIIQCRDVTAQ